MKTKFYLIAICVSLFMGSCGKEPVDLRDNFTGTYELFVQDDINLGSSNIDIFNGGNLAMLISKASVDESMVHITGYYGSLRAIVTSPTTLDIIDRTVENKITSDYQRSLSIEHGKVTKLGNTLTWTSDITFHYYDRNKNKDIDGSGKIYNRAVKSDY